MTLGPNKQKLIKRFHSEYSLVTGLFAGANEKALEFTLNHRENLGSKLEIVTEGQGRLVWMVTRDF